MYKTLEVLESELVQTESKTFLKVTGYRTYQAIMKSGK